MKIRRSGFSFIEIVVSVGILGSIVTPFLLAIQASYAGTGRNREYIQAWNLAREKIEELRTVPVRSLKSDFEIYVNTPNKHDNIFTNEFFGPYGRMKTDEEFFYEKFTDVWGERRKLTDSVKPRFARNFKKYYGFDYQEYPAGYERFRRTTQVTDLTDPNHPNNMLKKVIVTIDIERKGKKTVPVVLSAYMVNR